MENRSTLIQVWHAIKKRRVSIDSNWLFMGCWKSLYLLFVFFLSPLFLSLVQAKQLTESSSLLHYANIESLPPGSIPAIIKAMQKDLPAEYQLKKVDKSFTMSNPSHGLNITFTPTGPLINLGDSSCGLSMTGLGYEDSIQSIGKAKLVNDGGMMVYDRGSVAEWYLNSRWGIEQGFTVFEAPEKKPGSLIVELTLFGDLKAELIKNSIVFADASGKSLARYSGLQAFDVDGKILPAHLTLVETTLSINVDDSKAKYPITIDPWIQQVKLTASDGAASDYFGSSVSISGDTIVIGADSDDDNGDRSGSAYVFEKPSGGWMSMTEVAKLAPSDGMIQGYFGSSVAISGDTIVVGARKRDDPGHLYRTGAAYVFKKPEGGWVDMTETAVLTASDQAAVDYFGVPVAIDSETILVGASCGADYPVCSGAVYVFEKPQAGWSDMTETAKLTANDTFYFGKNFSINETTIVVGTYLTGDIGSGVFSSGAAFVFERPIDGWLSVTGTAMLTASDREFNDRFGTSVSVSGNTIVVGANLTDALDADGYNADDSGSAYIFERPTNGWITMTETARLTASDRSRDDEFGSSVFISGDTIVVGAPKDDNNAIEAGSAYIFKKPLTGWADSTESGKITANDGAYMNHFGNSISVSGKAIVIGAGGDQIRIPGAAYISFVKAEVSAYVGSFGTLDVITPSPQTVEYYSTTQFTFNAEAGYHISTISGCGIDYANTDEAILGKTVTTDTIIGDCTVTADFTINSNTIVAYAGDNGSLDRATPSPQTINYGESAEFTFLADTGYYIESITGCGINYFQNTDQSVIDKNVLTDPFAESCVVSSNSRKVLKSSNSAVC